MKGSRKQKLRQTTLTGPGTARSFPKPRASPKKRAFDSVSSDGLPMDDLPIIKLPVKASPEGRSPNNSLNGGPLPRPLRKKPRIIVESDSSPPPESTASVNRSNPRRTRLTRGRRIQRPSDAGKNRRKATDQGTECSTTSDEGDIVNEVETDRILENRLRSRDKKTAFQLNLEKLKRRKQGKPSLPSSSSSSAGDSSDGQDELIKGAKPSSERDSLFDEDPDESDSSDFIVEDEGDTPALLPTQFSMEAHQDLSYQFKKIFQFFVHIAVRPAKERHEFMEKQIRDEEYFSVPLQITRRKIYGLRDSLVASSVWRPEFKGPLETYPEFDLIPLDFAVPACDACHLGGRMSTLTGRLSGLPYNKLGFEILESDSDSDSDDSDSDSDDSKSVGSGTSTTVEFNLGRFCGRRTRVYHEFTHWEYSLFRCVRQEVDDLHASKQSGGFFRIAYSGAKKPPKDLDDADGIYEWLDERKVIDMEWQKIKDMMESARHLEMAKKDDDD